MAIIASWLRKILSEPCFVELLFCAWFLFYDLVKKFFIHRSRVTPASFGMDFQCIEEKVFVLINHLGED